VNRAKGLLALTLVATVALGCGGDDDDAGPSGTDAPETSTTAIGPPYEVVTEIVTLVDGSRPTPESAEAGVPASDARTLETTLTYPDAPGPFPFVAFAHGFAGHPRKFTQLHEAWAAAGYVVAAPAFPISNDEVPGDPAVADLPNQPGDVSFVIDEALRMNEEPGEPLFERVDPERIGVAGLSLGGATVYGVAFNDCCTDPRVDAAIVMDGAQLAIGGEPTIDNGTPLLLYHADGDPALPYEGAVDAFAAAAPPKYFITIHEVVHAQPFEDAPDPADEMVIDTSIAFWRLYLDDDEDAAADFTEAAVVPNLSTLEEEATPGEASAQSAGS
jgi:dienelactone hydrolase